MQSRRVPRCYIAALFIIHHHPLTHHHLCSNKRGSNKQSNETMLSTILHSSTNRPPLLRHPPMITQKLLRQTQTTMMTHPSVAHQWQRSLSVLPSMNILPKAIHARSNNLASLPSGHEGIRRLCSNQSHHIPIGSGGSWNRSSLMNTNSIIPQQQQQVRQFSSGGNLGNIFQHAQNANNNKNSKPGETLEQYGVDLTQLAKEGKLDPVIGRHEEIRRTLQILARRTKNNPVLIGEPGVGKCCYSYMVCAVYHIYLWYSCDCCC